MFCFELVAMVTTLGLWLAEHKNERNYKTKSCMFTIFGDVVYNNNAEKTMNPDFRFGCHGNQEPTNQVILDHNSNLETKFKNPASWFSPPIYA